MVVLQNIHLVARWLGTLEKLLEQHAEGSQENFRVFVSAEPSSTPEGHIIPQGILENSIKITNEPPTGMHANLHKALDNFNQVRMETLFQDPRMSLCSCSSLTGSSCRRKDDSESCSLDPVWRHPPVLQVDLIDPWSASSTLLIHSTLSGFDPSWDT